MITEAVQKERLDGLLPVIKDFSCSPPTCDGGVNNKENFSDNPCIVLFANRISLPLAADWYSESMMRISINPCSQWIRREVRSGYSG